MDSQHNSSTPLDVYQIVTDRIIELLEAGTIPWHKPWNDAGVPMNLISKRPYRGINLWLLLPCTYERNLWVTFEQLKKVGGSINKGEHGQMVVFWKQVKKVPEELDSTGNVKTVPLLRYYKIYNVSQCRNVPADLIPLVDDSNTGIDPIAECEAILTAFSDMPLISFRGKQAYYDVEKDEIILPKMKSFASSPSYYCTLFHELIHASGAKKRLHRKTITDMVPFGTPSYAVEELIAELGAAYLSYYTGILNTEIESSAAYISGWLEKLRSDKRFIISAAGQAQQAVDLILNRQDNEAKEELEESVGESVVS